MSTFTILSVDPETRRWGDKNDMIAYRVSLSGEQGNGKSVELSRHEKAAPPRPDEVVDGELKEYPPHGWKLVKPKGAPRASGGSGGGGGGYPEDPVKQRGIWRQSAQKAAVMLLSMEIQSGLIPPEKLVGAKASELLKPRIDFFFQDTVEGSKP